MFLGVGFWLLQSLSHSPPCCLMLQDLSPQLALPAARPTGWHTFSFRWWWIRPSATRSPDKTFFLEVALVMVSYHSNRRVNNESSIHDTQLALSTDLHAFSCLWFCAYVHLCVYREPFHAPGHTFVLGRASYQEAAQKRHPSPRVHGCSHRRDRSHV